MRPLRRQLRETILDRALRAAASVWEPEPVFRPSEGRFGNNNVRALHDACHRPLPLRGRFTTFGSTGSLSRASTPKTHSWTRYRGSLAPRPAGPDLRTDEAGVNDRNPGVSRYVRRW